MSTNLSSDGYILARTEDEHVKLPALIHATRLGYTYLSIKDKAVGIDWDIDTNIFFEQFKTGIEKANNKEFSDEQVKTLIQELKIKLSADDLGRAFFSSLQSGITGIRLIDYEHQQNNLYHVVTELPYVSGEDSFRPDITFLINGMPLAFMEVKRQNNKEGILAERNRITSRFKRRIFRRFANITQVMVFSNNQEYDPGERHPIQGSFYATTSYGEPFLSKFREERETEMLKNVALLDESIARNILKDNSLLAYFGSAEYVSSSDPTTPANRIITSLFSIDRILFLLKYGLCYVERIDKNGVTKTEKHIMRYPQLFATLALRDKLDQGIQSGIIWHTQGSGKTALSFFLTRLLRDYYQKHRTVAQFYFIVDRDELARQARAEFRARGLKVLEVSSRDAFNKNLENPTQNMGDNSIMVINLQKFNEETQTTAPHYNLNVQRIYFMDEAHRDYKPGGAYLTNMMTSDPNALKIALTGTPLVNKKGGYNSRDVFGDYIHKCYYNQSIADGYTLRLMREEIKTEFREKMKHVLENLKVLEGEIQSAHVFEHNTFVEPLVDYIANDYLDSMVAHDDDSIGAIIAATSATQARAIYQKLLEYEFTHDITSALVLYDEGSVKDREDVQKDFKDGKINILVVYNMLLTGFDAPRLKKLYLCRTIRAHNLLQALTRVNRPYGEFPHGYIVDFAGIEEEFDKTNRAYFKELQEDLGDAIGEYSSLFEDPAVIEQDLRMIKNVLFDYDIENLVAFIAQVDAIDDKQELHRLRAALQRYRELRNIVKMYGYKELLSRFDVEKANRLLGEVSNRIGSINLKEALAFEEMSTGNLNVALQNIEFHFHKIKNEELHIADEFDEKLRKTYAAFASTLDRDDPEYLSLMEELRKKFRSVNIEELTGDQMRGYIVDLDELKTQIDSLNNKDANLCAKYAGDAKFLRIHKTMLRTPPPIAADKITAFEILALVKQQTDQMIENNENVLDNEPLFEKRILKILKDSCQAQSRQPSLEQVSCIGRFITDQYQQERRIAS